MSRTYRLRHYPRLPGTAKKFVEGVGYNRHEKDEDKVWEQVSAVLGTPLRTSHTSRYHKVPWSDPDRAAKVRAKNEVYFSITKEERELFYTLEKQAVFEVARPWRHPWVGYCCAGRREKTWWKKIFNRLWRHRAKLFFNSRETDFEGDVHPENPFDYWKFS